MILVTGSSGFIGFNLCKELLEKGYDVVGIDNLNDYYDVTLKKKRTKILQDSDNFIFKPVDISELDKEDMKDVETIFHEAAYAGVRNSVKNPLLYDRVNVHGTVKLLKLSIDTNIEKFLFASSSSVYGKVEEFPTPETHPTNPKSPYGVSKLAAEKYCDAFHKCYGLSTISFRYFTVYGPWGRPDMLILKTIMSCSGKKKLLLFKKDGNVVDFSRDFSYIDNVVEANILAMESNIKNDVFNVASGTETSVMKTINIIKEKLGQEPDWKEAQPSPADPKKTLGDVTKIKNSLGYEHNTTIEQGIQNTIDWYMDYR